MGCELLDGLRVIDLTDDKGSLGGKILADLGADVIRVEPLTGGPTRNVLHRLIAKAFVGRPFRHLDKSQNILEVNHIDSNRTNCLPGNLEWVTHKENVEHSRKFGFVRDADEVLVRNILTNEIRVIYSASEAAREFGIHFALLAKHLKDESSGRVTKNWHVFKYNDGSDWPVLNYMETIENLWDMVPYWEAKCLITGDLIRANKRDQFCGQMEISVSTLMRTLAKFGPVAQIRNWAISKKWRNKTESVPGLVDYDEYRFPPPVDIHVVNEETQEQIIFGSLCSAAKHVGVKTNTLAYRFKKGNKINFDGFTLTKMA